MKNSRPVSCLEILSFPLTKGNRLVGPRRQRMVRGEDQDWGAPRTSCFPVVLSRRGLLGWLGAKPRNVARPSDWSGVFVFARHGGESPPRGNDPRRAPPLELVAGAGRDRLRPWLSARWKTFSLPLARAHGIIGTWNDVEACSNRTLGSINGDSGRFGGLGFVVAN